MPIHLDDLEVISKVEGIKTASIVACNMCAGASISMRENKPFIQLFKSFLKSPPLERYLKRLESQLAEKGVKTLRFKSGIIQQFFLCLWTSRQRNKLHEFAKRCDAVIVLGCDSAFETVRDSVKEGACVVIKGMEVAGVMNTKTKFHFPCDISFEASKTIPICDRHCKLFGQENQQEKGE